MYFYCFEKKNNNFNIMTLFYDVIKNDEIWHIFQYFFEEEKWLQHY